MRNLFDQYDQFENKLTHALLTCLANDRDLLSSFLRKIAGVPQMDGATSRVIEQAFPGDFLGGLAYGGEDESLPDGVIFDDKSRYVVIESKISKMPDSGKKQLTRHQSGMLRRSFLKGTGLVITTEKASALTQIKRWGLDNHWIAIGWPDVYGWVVGQNGYWATQLKSYLEIVEERMISSKKLNGQITVFSGIPFDGKDHPYNTFEAKHLMRLLKSSLAEKAHRLGLVPEESKLIPAGNLVWDTFRRQSDMSRGRNFISAPHFTYAIGSEYVEAVVTVPNADVSGCKRALRALSASSFEQACRIFYERLREKLPAIGNDLGICPCVRILQRHFPKGVMTASGSFTTADVLVDLRTVFGKNEKGNPKVVEQWLPLAHDGLVSGWKLGANVQFQIGCNFTYRSKLVRNSDLVDAIVASWEAGTEFLKHVQN